MQLKNLIKVDTQCSITKMLYCRITELQVCENCEISEIIPFLLCIAILVQRKLNEQKPTYTNL